MRNELLLLLHLLCRCCLVLFYFFINCRQLTFNRKAFWRVILLRWSRSLRLPPADLFTDVRKNHTDPGFLFSPCCAHLFSAHTALLWFSYLNVCRDSDGPEMRAAYLRCVVWWCVTLFLVVIINSTYLKVITEAMQTGSLCDTWTSCATPWGDRTPLVCLCIILSWY